MKIKTSELIDAALDWAVAKCEGALPASYDDWVQTWPRYSTDWAQGGPIVEREKIDLFTEKQSYAESWCASMARYQNGVRLVGWRLHQYGPTPLVAAMRCYVASRLGEEVEVPDELIKENQP